MNRIIYIGLILVAMISCSKSDGTITGTASANDGAITSDITVKLYTTETDLHSTTMTNSEGEFAFTDLESGNYYIGATVIVNSDTFDTGFTPQLVYVSDEIVKEVTLTLNKR